jgi:hypothetical protein
MTIVIASTTKTPHVAGQLDFKIARLYKTSQGFVQSCLYYMNCVKDGRSLAKRHVHHNPPNDHLSTVVICHTGALKPINESFKIRLEEVRLNHQVQVH